jgi:hypothetical protein
VKQRILETGYSILDVISTEGLPKAGPFDLAQGRLRGEIWSRTQGRYRPQPDASTSLSMTNRGAFHSREGHPTFHAGRCFCIRFTPPDVGGSTRFTNHQARVTIHESRATNRPRWALVWSFRCFSPALSGAFLSLFPAKLLEFFFCANELNRAVVQENAATLWVVVVEGKQLRPGLPCTTIRYLRFVLLCAIPLAYNTPALNKSPFDFNVLPVGLAMPGPKSARPQSSTASPLIPG